MQKKERINLKYEQCFIKQNLTFDFSTSKLPNIQDAFSTGLAIIKLITDSFGNELGIEEYFEQDIQFNYNSDLDSTKRELEDLLPGNPNVKHQNSNETGPSTNGEIKNESNEKFKLNLDSPPNLKMSAVLSPIKMSNLLSPIKHSNEPGRFTHIALKKDPMQLNISGISSDSNHFETETFNYSKGQNFLARRSYTQFKDHPLKKLNLFLPE